MEYTYDKLGRITGKTDGQGYCLNYAYDSMGRVTAVTSSAGQKKSYTYDALGNATSMTDANGNTTYYEYTLGGRLKAVTDALGNRAEYAYDNEDRLIHICQKGNAGEADRETFYERNPLGQVECIRDAFGNEEHYEYDALGRTILKADRDGYRTAYDHTADGKISHILYGDGTSVEMEYTALRQLALVKNWLGETRIERDEAGNPVCITDHKGKTVSYEWGSMGERKGITYPDGRRVLYHYDDQMRLEKMQMEKSGSLPGMGSSEKICYRYDGMGRISEKQFPDGMRTLWHYDDRGQLTELIHEDEGGILDRYRYEYDLMGNKTAVTKERRGLREESGRYEYGYDALSRLVSVSRDGNALREYAYDAFGNRSSMEDYGRGRNVSYIYDALNRLTSAEEGSLDAMVRGDTVHTDYSYDNRGNMIREETGGRLIHGYEYGAMNRLAKAWDDKGQEALYRYNGLGQRTGKTVNGRDEDYLLDLTKPYHNLLGISGEGNEQCFYFDWNVAAMEEKGKGADGSGRRASAGLHYYMQDELGSPLRVSGFGAGEGALSGRSSYLCYGYDEFGNDLGRELEGAGIPDPYDGQGREQPFGYTGYRYDEISGTYFAQAREYQVGNGRFTAEDLIKGNGAEPGTLNRYGYCLENPVMFIDPDGKEEISIWDFFFSDGMDDEGIAIGLHYLYGDGKSINDENGNWGKYLMKNEVLTGKVGDIVMPIGYSLQNDSSISIDMQFPMVIENGEGIVGYKYLHGTNEDVGGFQITGTISKDTRGDMIFDLTYSWNDIMDPNPTYSTDMIKAGFAKTIPFANPTDFEMHITWSDKTIIRQDEGWFRKNKGWLKNWNENWMPENYASIDWLNNWENDLEDIKLQYSNYYSNCAQ